MTRRLSLIRLVRAVGFVVVIAIVGDVDVGVAASARSETYYAEARALIDQGRVDAALKQLEKALDADSDNVAARYLLGELYIGLGDAPAAERELWEARARGLDDARAMPALGYAYLLQGKYTQILADVRGGGHGDPIEAEIFLIRGQAYVGLNRLDEATDAFEGAAQLQPGDPRPKVALARMWIERGDLAVAEEYADAALALDPRAVEVRILKGVLRRLNRDLESAVGHFTEALKLDPKSKSARLERAASLIDLDRDDAAKADIRAVRATAPNDPDAFYLSALIAAKGRNYRAAEDALRRALRLRDGDPPSIFLLGAVEYARNKLDAAEADLSRYLEGDPGHAAARKLLGATLIRKNDPERALEVLLPALKLAPGDRQTLALLGSAYMYNGQYLLSTAYFERAAVAASATAAGSAQLALGRQAIEEPAAAASQSVSDVGADPLAAQAGILRALTQLRNRDFDAVLAQATALVEAMPDNPLAYNLRAAAEVGMGDIAAARADYEKALELQPDYLPARLNLARLDYGEGDPQGARKRLGTVLERDSGNVRALVALAQLAEGEGRNDEAVSWLERARDANPRAVAPRLRLVNLHLRTGDTAQALAEARELERFAGASPETLDALARAHVAVGDAGSAAATYRRLVELAPDSAEAYHRLAAAQATAKDHAGARESLRTATTVEPDYLPAWMSLIEIELRAERTDEALALARALRKARPDDAIGDTLTGDVLMRVGKFSEAAGAYRAARGKADSAALAVRLYSAEASAGNTDTALAVLEEWVADHVNDVATTRALASAYLKAGRFEPAAELHRRLLETRPNDPLILRNLARALDEIGDRRALGYAERAYEIAPQSVSVIDALGWILVRRGRVANGLELLRKANAGAPDEAEIGYHLAVALASLGDRDEARRTLENILAPGTPFDAADKARALLEQLSGG